MLFSSLTQGLWSSRGLFLLVDDDEVSSVVNASSHRMNLAQNPRHLNILQHWILVLAKWQPVQSLFRLESSLHLEHFACFFGHFPEFQEINGKLVEWCDAEQCLLLLEIERTCLASQGGPGQRAEARRAERARRPLRRDQGDSNFISHSY